MGLIYISAADIILYKYGGRFINTTILHDDSGCSLMASLHPATPTPKHTQSTMVLERSCYSPHAHSRPSYATPILTTPLLESARFINKYAGVWSRYIVKSEPWLQIWHSHDNIV